MIYCVILLNVSTDFTDASNIVQGVSMRNNPFVLLTLLILSGILYYGESKNPSKLVVVEKESLVLKALVLESSFNAHDMDKTARSLVLESKSDLKCNFSGDKDFSPCKSGERITWSSEAYSNNFKVQVKDELGNIKSFSPKSYNPFITFHKCDVLFKKGGSEASFRRTLRDLRDMNQDQMKILCLDEGVKLKATKGAFIIRKDMAIIGTHHNTATILGDGVKSVFKNEQNSLFLYNLNLETNAPKTTAISLGVGSYLGANNLNIKTSSFNSKGISCFGCTMDGEGLKVLSSSLFTTAISSSLGLIELRRSTLQGAIGVLSRMGSNINLIDGTLLATSLIHFEN